MKNDDVKKVYISGKISGLEYADAIDHFEDAENWISEQDQCPVNPMRLLQHDMLDYADYLKADIAVLIQCDAIYMLDNYVTSPGARLELSIAKALDLEIVYEAGRPYEDVAEDDINDPICWIHDLITAELEETKDCLDMEENETAISTLDRCIELLQAAKAKGQSMEDRLRKYYNAIVDLGFERNMEE